MGASPVASLKDTWVAIEGSAVILVLIRSKQMEKVLNFRYSLLPVQHTLVHNTDRDDTGPRVRLMRYDIVRDTCSVVDGLIV